MKTQEAKKPVQLDYESDSNNKTIKEELEMVLGHFGFVAIADALNSSFTNAIVHNKKNWSVDTLTSAVDALGYLHMTLVSMVESPENPIMYMETDEGGGTWEQYGKTLKTIFFQYLEIIEFNKDEKLKFDILFKLIQIFSYFKKIE